MKPTGGPALAVLALAAGGALASAATFVTEQADGHSPVAWRTLDADEQARFDLGHAAFNTGWVPAGRPAGRRDGLGPAFNAASCDACHNSRRRGRGPDGDGPAPPDLVMQVGRRSGDGIARGHRLFGEVINTAAVDGYRPEAAVSIRYDLETRRRHDGTTVIMRRPEYTVTLPGRAPLPDDLVLMPRMPPSIQGVGLLEEVPETAIAGNAGGNGARLSGQPSWLETPGGKRLGRYGWQASQPSLEAQVASAFAREMGLTTALTGDDDCTGDIPTCGPRSTDAAPEVDQELFQAVVAFQRWETARRPPSAAQHLRTAAEDGALFERIGCGDCHRSALPLRTGGWIAAYTDLRLHDLGPDLADRDSRGRPLPGRWRTAPLWGLGTAAERGRPLRLLHDGRAHGVEEAIAWHAGEAAAARARFEALDAGERGRLVDWVSAL